MTTTSFECDLIVIGGGSGGMAAAKEAVTCGASRVVLFDFVTPTEHGTKWGLGGTCVNVGCIPKKLMHYTASMGPVLHHDAKHFGWKINNLQDSDHDWQTLVSAVQGYIKKLNFNYKVGLRSKGVEYINSLARIEGPNSVSYINGKTNERTTITSKYILIAVGGRPNVPNDIPGAKKFAVTSDDLFSLKKSPGKTLVVGASYIALECAGFLTELGYDTTVAVRSILLRGFDRQCSEKVGALMKEIGTKFKEALPTSIVQAASSSSGDDGCHRLRVTFSTGDDDEFDTVMFATGRRADTAGLNLTSVGIDVDDVSGKISAVNEETSVSSIFVVGDALKGVPELTPVAIKTGELLVRRLFTSATTQMDWNLIPTTVFTPFEYGCCGLSEEQAIEKYGVDDIEVYLFEFPTLEVAASHREKVSSCQLNEYDAELSPNSLSKLICVKSEDERVVGFHFVGLNAGEMTQGYALAMRCGATKADFDDTIGIHPTDAESFHNLTVTRRSGESWVASGGCGGGKCG